MLGLAVVPNPPLENLEGDTDAGAQAIQQAKITREITFQVDISIRSRGQKLVDTARKRSYGQSQEWE